MNYEELRELLDKGGISYKAGMITIGDTQEEKQRLSLRLIEIGDYDTKSGQILYFTLKGVPTIKNKTYRVTVHLSNAITMMVEAESPAQAEQIAMDTYSDRLYDNVEIYTESDEV